MESRGLGDIVIGPRIPRQPSHRTSSRLSFHALTWQDETMIETGLLYASDISPQTTMGGVGHSMSRVLVNLELLASTTPVKCTPNSLNANPTPPSISTKVAIR